MQRPRLRDNKGKRQFEPYPLGRMPSNMIYEMGKYFTYQYLIGAKDLTGSIWGDVFAAGIGGKHLDSPLGIADVVYENMAWSTKTVKHIKPHNQNKVRIISGRCSRTIPMESLIPMRIYSVRGRLFFQFTTKELILQKINMSLCVR